MSNSFVKQLQQEAKLQKKLYETRIIPKQFDPITSFIGENALATLFGLAVVSAIFLELVKML